MKILRALGKFLGSTIFTTFLVSAILIMEIISFTSYDNFKLLAGGLVETQLSSVLSDENLATLQTLLFFQCAQADKISVPMGRQDIILNCSDVKDADRTQLKSAITIAVVDGFYYKKFDCKFIDCIKSGGLENLLIVATNEGNQFYKSLQIYLWVGTAVGLALLLVSIETWVGRLKGVGWNLAVTGFPFVFFKYVKAIPLPSIPAETQSFASPIIDSLLTSLGNKLMIVFVVGVIFLVAGYGLGFYLSRVSKKGK